MVIMVNCADCDSAVMLDIEFNEVFSIKCPKCGCAKFNNIAFQELVTPVKVTTVSDNVKTNCYLVNDEIINE